VHAVRPLLRPLRDLLRTLRFRAWVLRCRLVARRHGARFVIDAPHGARFATMPLLVVAPYRPRGATQRVIELRLGRNVDLGRDTTIEFRPEGRNVLELGDHVVLRSGVRFVLLDGAVRLGAETRVRDGAMMKSAGDLRIGRRAIIGYDNALHCSTEMVLEDMVGLAERVSILDSDHGVDGSGVYHQDQPILRDPVRIGSNVLVGANVVILRGARLGCNAAVAAGAVIRAGDYPEGWILGGVPARPLKALPNAPLTPDVR
jgi:acetyltransferase-like isoleucine patch superfamily enzyme